MLIRNIVASVVVSIAFGSACAAEKTPASKAAQSTPTISQSVCDPVDSTVAQANSSVIGGMVLKTKNCCTGDKCSDKTYCDTADCKCKRKPAV